MRFDIPLLPIKQEIETKSVLKQLAQSHRHLALLNGKCATIPNEKILINTLGSWVKPKSIIYLLHVLS